MDGVILSDKYAHLLHRGSGSRKKSKESARNTGNPDA